MKFIIQSFGDIITNSSTETFCVSNGAISDLQDFIDTILEAHGIKNSLISVTEVVDYDSLSNLREGQLESLAQTASDRFGVDYDIFLEYLHNHQYDELEILCSQYGTSLLEISRYFNEENYYGMIFTIYSIIADTNLVNTEGIKEKIEHLQDLFSYGEYEY